MPAWDTLPVYAMSEGLTSTCCWLEHAPRPAKLHVNWRCAAARAGGAKRGLGEPHIYALRPAEPHSQRHQAAPLHAQPDLAVPAAEQPAGVLRHGADRELRAV